ncbi:MGMT family protein [Virgibacillus xinjiangensis]|uniref:MGMT family protein n=1 Tax=Virgibacillus xinjiangensis TaxID=393090 RepID=A0ABV7CXX1_9BACI
MKPFTSQVIHIIQQIPPGKVMSYGQIAKVAGSPRAARQVVRILHSMSAKYDLPWHRVINAKGQVAMREENAFEQQKFLLEEEGVEVTAGGVIDLDEYQFHIENCIPDEEG